MIACHIHHRLPIWIDVPLLGLIFIILIGCLIMLVGILREQLRESHHG